MSLFTRALAAPFKLYNSVADEVAKERRLRLTDGVAWSAFAGRRSNSGQHVTDQSALQLAAAWACIKITAQAASSLPLAFYEKDAKGSRVEIEDGDLVEVLAESPNRDQTPLEFWETQTAWLLTRGNAYSEIVDSPRGRLISLENTLPASKTFPYRKQDGTLVYKFNDRGKPETLPREKVLHFKGFGQGMASPDLGLSPIAVGANSFGAAQASQQASASTFANGMRPSGFFTFDQQLTPEQRELARKNLIEPLKGSDKAGSIGILESGVGFSPMSLNPEDTQLLETRRFDVEEICRWFGVPPIVIGHSAEGQTMWGSGVEQILITWLTLGIDPICDRFEARIRKDLCRRRGYRRRYAEFNREALLQMDSKAKAAFLSTMVENGLMDRNEGRQKLNLPRRDGADELTAQVNLAPLDKLGEKSGGASLQNELRNFLGIDATQKGQSNDET